MLGNQVNSIHQPRCYLITFMFVLAPEYSLMEPQLQKKSDEETRSCLHNVKKKTTLFKLWLATVVTTPCYNSCYSCWYNCSWLVLLTDSTPAMKSSSAKSTASCMLSSWLASSSEKKVLCSFRLACLVAWDRDFWKPYLDISSSTRLK